MWCAWCCACLFWAACSPHGAPCSEPLSWCSSRWALTSSKARAYSRLAFLPCSFFWPSRRASWAECPRYSDVSRSPKRLLEVNDMNYLRCRDVHKSYGGVKVLLGVNFEIRGGEILGLLGTNGAGKSTLIDIISGITPIGEGAIYLGEHEARGQGSETRAYQGLARTFQHPQVAKELTLRENVLIGASVDELKGLPRVFGSAIGGFFKGWGALSEQVERVCADVALDDIERLAGEVTFGTLRVIEMARVLMQKPKVVLLDEPFSGVGDSGIHSSEERRAGKEGVSK